jgi:hypothetical protein
VIIQVDIPEYKGEGFCFEWEENFKIVTKIDFEQKTIGIEANNAGLISLARHLLELAQSSVPAGYHFHLDDYGGLEKGSYELVIGKIE